MSNLTISGTTDDVVGDAELRRVHAVIGMVQRVAGRSELECLFGRLLAAGCTSTARRTRVLDLVGYSVSPHGLLALGEWTLDAANPTVAAFFRELCDQDVLARLGITAVRLVGCATAVTAAARWTVCALADLLGVTVSGTTTMIGAPHFTAAGFTSTHALISNRELRAGPVGCGPLFATAPISRRLDIDALRAEPLAPPPARCPRYAIAGDDARELLAFVDREDAHVLPGLLAAPACELALPARADAYHRVQILARGQLVRVFPVDGPVHGVLYGVNDPAALTAMVEALRHRHAR
jgi:hypothetical protein